MGRILQEKREKGGRELRFELPGIEKKDSERRARRKKLERMRNKGSDSAEVNKERKKEETLSVCGFALLPSHTTCGWSFLMLCQKHVRFVASGVLFDESCQNQKREKEKEKDIEEVC